MFGLRQKLFLGFGGLLIVLAAIGAQSILHISKLGDSIDVILRENYRSVIACQQMKEALERIDSGLLFTLLGETEQGAELIRKNEDAFEQSLQVELQTITLPGEGDQAHLLENLYRRYQGSLSQVMDPARPAGLRRDAYFSGLWPLFGQIKNTAEEILQMNQRNMAEANDRARRRAVMAQRQMIILLAVEALASLLFIAAADRWILRPIRRLTRSADEIRRGNLDLVVDSGSHDEIGRLSESFNSMASKLRELRRSDQTRLIRIQRATQQAFDSLPEAVAVLDLEGKVEVSTEPAKTIFGLKPNASIFQLSEGWMALMFNEALSTGRTSRPGDTHRLIQQFVAGEERYFKPEAVPILDHERQPAGVILVFRDVTQLRQQDEIKKGVIRTVSHQLKTPLTSVRMAIHLLLEEKVGPLSEKQAELLVAARDDSDRLSGILNSLLDLSRIESGKAALDFHPTSPSAMIREATELFRRTAQDQGLTFEVRVPDDIPEVWADTTRIGHVFANLLSNALKFTPPGGRITLSAEADKDMVRFSIADTGRGIPGPYAPRVFDLFFRVPDQGKETGAGLGLAIVKEIVEAHGGSVGVESREGQGAVFTFTLRQADRVTNKEDVP